MYLLQTGRTNLDDRGREMWEWLGAGLILVSLILVTTRVSSRFVFLHDTGFFLLAILAFAFVVVSWEILSDDRHPADFSPWRRRVSFCGCTILSCALLSPFFGITALPSRMSWQYWSFGMGLVASCCGLSAPRPLRFCLFFGGLTIASVVLVMPFGVL